MNTKKTFLLILLIVSILFFISCSSFDLNDTIPLPKNLQYIGKIELPFLPDKIVYDDYDNSFILLKKSENIIGKMNHSGKITQEIGEVGFGKGQFLNIADIACDSFGNLYVLDNDINKINKYDENGQFISDLTFSEINDPELLEVKDNGDLLVYDSSSNQIFCYDYKNNLRWKFGKFEMISPQKICSTININYILDNAQNKIILFDNFGGFIKKFSHKEKIKDISCTKFLLFYLDSSSNIFISKKTYCIKTPLYSLTEKFSGHYPEHIFAFQKQIGMFYKSNLYLFQYSDE